MTVTTGSRADLSASRRLEAVREALSEEGLDALLVSHPPNLRYLSGFTGSAGLLWLEDARALLLVDSRYGQQAEAEAGPGVEVLLADDGLLEGLGERVAGLEGRPCGYEAHRLTVQQAGRLGDEAEGPSWRRTDGIVEEVRARKDDGEIERLRAASAAACEAFSSTLGVFEEGMTERELATELDYRLRRAGTGAPAFDTIVASGPRSALPHARPSQRRIRAGDLVLSDFGATVEGYCSDMTRTVVVGSPRPWQRRIHEAVRGAVEAALGSLQPGRPASDVDAAARSALEDRSLDDGVYGHSVGHGIGLEVHEKPSLSGRSDDILHEGNVVTVEPAVYLRDRGGVRLEEDVVVADPVDVLTDGVPRELDEL